MTANSMAAVQTDVAAALPAAGAATVRSSTNDKAASGKFSKLLNNAQGSKSAADSDQQVVNDSNANVAKTSATDGKPVEKRQALTDGADTAKAQQSTDEKSVLPGNGEQPGISDELLKANLSLGLQLGVLNAVQVAVADEAAGKNGSSVNDVALVATAATVAAASKQQQLVLQQGVVVAASVQGEAKSTVTKGLEQATVGKLASLSVASGTIPVGSSTVLANAAAVENKPTVEISDLKALNVLAGTATVQSSAANTESDVASLGKQQAIVVQENAANQIDKNAAAKNNNEGNAAVTSVSTLMSASAVTDEGKPVQVTQPVQHEAISVTAVAEQSQDLSGESGNAEGSHEGTAKFAFSGRASAAMAKSTEAKSDEPSVATAFAAKLEQGMATQTAKATQDATGVMSHNVQDKYDIASQIVDRMRLINKLQSSEMVIQLKPEHLGELTLKVAVNDGVVSASFHSESLQVRNVIESSLNQLKQEFANSGIKVDNVGVYTNLDSFMANDQQQASQQQQMKFAARSHSFADDEIDAVELAATDSIQSLPGVSDDGVDYRV